jgi:hypothetical protein
VINDSFIVITPFLVRLLFCPYTFSGLGIERLVAVSMPQQKIPMNIDAYCCGIENVKELKNIRQI